MAYNNAINKVTIYRTSSGRSPVSEFINNTKCCPVDKAAKIFEYMKLLEELGLELIKDGKVKKIISVRGLYELRPSEFRLFFSICQQNFFMIYNIIRKGKNVSDQDKAIDIAKNRMEEMQSNGICK